MLKTAEEQNRKRLWWFHTVTMLLCGIIYFTAQFSSVSVMIYRRYIPMIVWAVMAIAFYRKDYKLRSVYGLGLVFLGWFVLTRWLQGDLYLNPSYNFFVEFCISYGLLLPFAMLSREGERRSAFDIMAMLMLILVVFIAVFSVISAVTRTTVQVPLAGFIFEMRNHRIWPMGLNPNVAAPMFNCGMFLLIYLLATYKREWMLLPGGILFLVIFIACSLTASRGGILGASIGFGVIGCILASKIKLRKKHLRAAVMLVCFAGGFFISYKATELSVNVVTVISEQICASEADEGEAAAEEEASAAIEEDETTATSRSLLKNLGTLSGRVSIYRELFEGLRANPIVYLIGCADSEVMNLLDRYQAWMTLHSSFLQTLALTGVVGLILILLFCVLVFLAALKVLLDTTKTLGQRLLPVVMVPLIFHSLLESILFVPWTALGPISIVNFVFMLSAGYTVEMAKGLKFKELLRPGKE